MSLNFWVNLVLATVIFLLSLVFINRSKIKAIRYYLAARLRRQALPKLNEILPILTRTFQSNDSDKFPLFRLRADLEAICLKADVLFDEEKSALLEFLDKLSSALTNAKTNSLATNELDNLILAGQRTINELNELGRNSAKK